MATLRSALAELFPLANSSNNANMADAIGRKDDSAITTVGTTKSLMAYIKGVLNQLANIKNQTNTIELYESSGLESTHDSIAYMIAEIENHLHAVQQWYGYESNLMVRGSLTPLTLGTNIIGSSSYLMDYIFYHGTEVESGVYFDLNNLRISGIGTANRLVFLQFLDVTLIGSTWISATSNSVTDKIYSVDHGLQNGQAIVMGTCAYFDNLKQVFYVINKTNDDFQLSEQLGGSLYDITGGTGSAVEYKLAEVAILSECYVSRQSTTPDTFITPIQGPPISRHHCIAVRGKASGGTNSVSLYVGLHSYSN